MATRPGDINANIGVALDAQGMGGNLKALQESISGIVQMLNKAGAAAEKSVAQTGRVGAEAAKEIRQLLQSVSQTQQSISRLGQVNTKNLFGGFTDANSIGKMAAGVDRFFRGLESGSPTIEKLTSRLTLMNQQAAQMLQGGQIVPRNFWDKRLAVQNAMDAFKKIDTSYQRMSDRISNLSPGGQAKLAPGLAGLQTAMQEFDRLASNPRSNAALSAKLQTLRQISTQLEQQIKLVLQEERSEQVALNTSRRRAEAMLAATAAQREADLRASANRYSTILAGRTGGGQFNDVLNGDPSARLKNQAVGMETVQRISQRLVQTQTSLNAAMSSNAPVERLNTLIGRMETLKDLQAISLAQANRAQSSGFFGGIVQGVQTVTRGPGGEGLGLGGIGNLIGRVGAFTAAYRAINLVSAGMRDAISFTIQWEDQLAQLQAISGATGSEMASLSNSILEVSKNSASTVSEISDAAKILAQAGYSAKETGDLLQNVVNLSAASGATPAEAVDILTSAMGAFNLQVSDSAHITDALVTTLNRTKLSAQQVQLGLQYLGATAKENNLTFEDLVSVLGAAADAGIRSGSTMATGTRQLLIDLADPTKKLVTELENIGLTMGDVDVKTRGLIPVLQTLRDHGFNAFQAIETRAAAMYEVLSDNLDEMRDLRAQTLQTNTAHEAAAKRLDSLNAQWVELKNNMSGVASTMGSVLLPILKVLVLALNGITEAAVKAGQSVSETFNTFAIQHPVLLATTQLFGDLISLVSGTGDALDSTQTKIDDASSAVSNQRSKIKSLEEEYQNIIQRSGDLKTGSSDLQYEINRLSERFPGLREELEKSGKTADGLAEALLNLDVQAKQTLSGLSQEAANANAQMVQVASRQALNQRQQLLDAYPEGSQQRKIIELLGTPRSDPHADVRIDQGKQMLELFKASNDISKEMKDQFVQKAEQLLSSYQVAQTSRIARDAALIAISQSAFGKTPIGKQFTGVQLADQARANTVLSQSEGLDLEERRAKIQPVLDEIDKHIRAMASKWEYFSKSGATAAANATLAIKKAEETSAKRLKSAMKPTEEEQRELDRKPHGPGAGRTMTSAQIAAALQKHFPGIVISSGYRGPGNKLYDPGSWHSNMPGGHAVDIAKLPSGTSIDNVIAFLESLGQQIDLNNPNSYLNEFLHPSKHATGGHYHIGVMAKESRAQSQDERQKEQEQREADRAQQELEQDRLEARKRELTNLENALAKETDLNNILGDIDAIEFAFHQYAIQQRDRAKADLARRHIGPDDPRFQERMNAAEDQITAEHEAEIRKEAEALAGFVERYLRDGQKVIDDVFKDRLLSLRQNVATQEGLLSGLDNPRLAGQVPDYTRTLQQRRVDLANQDLTDATMAANEDKIKRMRDLLADISTKWNEAAVKDPEAAKLAYAQYAQSVMAVQNTIDDLVTEQAKLVAQAQALSLVPKNWNDAISQAVQAWNIQNNMGLSLNQRIWGQLGDAIESVHGSFQQFFIDIMSGTKSVGRAFGDMAKAIGQALVEMAAKAVATQIFGLLLSFIPGAVGGSSLMTNTAPGLLSLTGYRGGLIEKSGRAPKRYSVGGLVGSGIPSRDSVPALLSKNEFVMRNSAVQSIGHELLMDMNNRGAAALDKLHKQPVVMAGGQPQETNVWVVLPEEKPVPGPNDILAVVHNDVLRNGATKALIKRVSQGG